MSACSVRSSRSIGHYDKVPDVGNPVDPEMSGTGFMGGVVAGFNWQVDSFVLGIEGDYQLAAEIADNENRPN